MKKFLSLLLTLSMIVTLVIGGTGLTFAASGSTAATTMKIAGTDGTVTITTDKGKDIAAKVDTKLLSGYTIKTAAASYCFISLDDSKAIKLGQNTKVKVEKSSKKIELTLKSGEIYFDVDQKLSGDESMNIKTANMTTGIRGTNGVAKIVEASVPVAVAAFEGGGDYPDTQEVFQLFSGKMQLRENSSAQPTLQSALQRLSDILNFRSADNSSNVTTITAGNQATVTQKGNAAGGAAVSVEQKPVEVSAFGARAALESVAISQGAEPQTVMTESTENLTAQYGANLQENMAEAGVAQQAINQIQEAVAEPAKLDQQIQEEEEQAAQDEANQQQTITEAKAEAAQAPGTTTNDKALEKVDVKTEAGANAGDLKLSDDGTSTSATAGSGSTSTGGHSGGSTQPTSWLRGYSGVYDNQPHLPFVVQPEQLDAYDIWVFEDEAVLRSMQQAYNAAVSAEAIEFLSTDATWARIHEEIYRFQWHINNSYNSDGSVNMESARNEGYLVANVSDSKTFYFFALQKNNYQSTQSGSFNASISRAELAVEWRLTSDSSVIATPNAVYPTTTTTIPVTPVLGVKRTATTESGGTQEVFQELMSDFSHDTIDGERVELEPVTNGTVPNGAGSYSVRITSVVRGSAVTQTDNYSFPGSTYNYTLSDGNTGSANDPGSSQEPRNILESADWDDYTKYDVAYIKPSNSDNYSEYRRGVLQGEAGAMPYDYVLRALQSTGASEDMPYFESIYWDMGPTAMDFSGLDVNNLNIYAGANDKAILISGGGVTGVNTLSLQSSGVGKVYLRADNNRRTVAINCQTLTVGANTEFTNYGEVTYSSTFNVYGTVDNFRYVSNTGDSAAGIGVVGGKYMQHNILSNDNGSYTKDIRTDNSGMFVLSNRGEVHMYGGQLIRRHAQPDNNLTGTSKLSQGLSLIFGANVYGEGKPMQTTSYAIHYNNGYSDVTKFALKCSYNTEAEGSISGEYESGEAESTLHSGILWITEQNYDINFASDNSGGTATLTFPTKYIYTAEEGTTGSGG